MKYDLIPYQNISLSAPSTAGVPDYQKFVAPYEWKPRNQNVFYVKSHQAAVIKINYNFNSFINPVDPDPFEMQFKFILEGSSDGMIYMTVSEWTMVVSVDGSNSGPDYNQVLEIPLLGISYLRPVLQSVNLRGCISIVAQMYLR